MPTRRTVRNGHPKPPAPPPDPISVRIPVAVQMTGISRTKLYALIKDGQIATVKIGTATLIPVEGLRAFIKNHSH